ncbi:hypothetical protein B0H34DRAFT_720591 [Crassisporium funariophilum]|nr:hypothetical protein B0H34DRAFT_720591 [Crassisporium funariophilum]
MSDVYNDFLYWGFLGLVNLSASIAVFRLTKLERKQQLASEYELSTRPIVAPFSFPSSFTFLSCLTGCLNASGAYLRFCRIHYLDIPTIPWLEIASANGSEEFLKLLEAEWIVAMNDWTSLFLGMTFLISACFNFATVRQLRLRDRWVREGLLPVYRPCYNPEKSEPTSAAVGGIEESKTFAIPRLAYSKRG